MPGFSMKGSGIYSQTISVSFDCDCGKINEPDVETDDWGKWSYECTCGHTTEGNVNDD